MITRAWVKYWLKDPFWGGLDYLVHYTLRAFPIDTVSAIGERLGRLAGKHRLKSAHRRVLHNLSVLFPEKTPEERQCITGDMWGQIGRTYAEFSVLDKFDQDRIAFSDSSSRLPAGKATIFLFAHLGNWEVLGHYPKRLGQKIFSVREVLDNRFEFAIAEKSRKRVGYHPIMPDRHGVTQMFRILENKGSFWMAIDEYKDKNVVSPSFHRSLSLDTNIAYAVKLAIKFDAVLAPVYCLRRNGAYFTIHVMEPIYPTHKGAFEATVEQLNRVCETWIRQHPDQWYMLHRLKLPN